MAMSRYIEGKSSALEIPFRDTDMYIEYTLTSRLDLLANSIYGAPDYWWIILAANPEYSIEFEIEFGDIVRVPMPLGDVLRDIKNQIED